MRWWQRALASADSVVDDIRTLNSSSKFYASARRRSGRPSAKVIWYLGICLNAALTVVNFCDCRAVSSASLSLAPEEWLPFVDSEEQRGNRWSPVLEAGLDTVLQPPWPSSLESLGKSHSGRLAVATSTWKPKPWFWRNPTQKQRFKIIRLEVILGRHEKRFG